VKFKDLPHGNMSFLKIDPGSSVKGIFRGDPYEFRIHWVAGASTVCTGKDCPSCADSIRSSFRFRINFITNENSNFTAKVWEGGKKVYEMLKALHESEYNLEKHAMKISRSGSGTDTTYSVIPVANGTIKPDVEKVLSAIELNKLSPDEA
jgi:hypothetical protein